MSAFAAAEGQTGSVLLHIELKGVNHRFLDISLKMPRAFSECEGEVKELLAEQLSRGRIELLVNRVAVLPSGVPPTGGSAPRSKGRSKSPGARVTIDAARIHEAFDAQRKVLLGMPWYKALARGERHMVETGLLQDLFRRPEMLEIPEEPPDLAAERTLLLNLLRKALLQFVSMQQREGAALERELRARLEVLTQAKLQIAQRVEGLSDRLRAKLQARVAQLASEVNIEPGRVAAEVALLCERADVTEELVRLESHISQFKHALQRSPSGKRFDYLLQEMHREVNTIGSKAQDAEVQRLLIDAKIEIEKLREQVQNVV
jgi:uncharacterized protein (TIGR00255 family)